MRFVLLLCAVAMTTPAHAQTAQQPRVAPGPNEPDWVAILRGVYDLDMFADLLNPVQTTPEETPGLFVKVGPGPVSYTPLMALGLETLNRGGWYVPADDPGQIQTHELWSYQFKNTGRDIETGSNWPPPLAEGATTRFDPGMQPFGLWISNDGLDESDVYTQPQVVEARNNRLASQPYKAMIYPYKDPETGELVPNSYLIGWEYSTNDDFQDIVCRVDNVQLVVPVQEP